MFQSSKIIADEKLYDVVKIILQCSRHMLKTLHSEMLVKFFIHGRMTRAWKSSKNFRSTVQQIMYFLCSKENLLQVSVPFCKKKDIFKKINSLCSSVGMQIFHYSKNVVV